MNGAALLELKPLELGLFGMPRLRSGNSDLALPSRKALAVLAYLALEGSGARATLAGLLWPDLDEASARRNLRRELARLRDGGLGEALISDGETLRLAPQVSSDAARFETLLARGETAAALALYAGPLLAGLEPGRADAFAAWLEARREGLHRAYRTALQGEAERQRMAGEARAALDLYHRLLTADPLHEGALNEAMRLHASLGERTAALALFETFRRALGATLGVAPLAATTDLAERLMRGSLPPGSDLSGSGAGEPGRVASAPLVGRDAALARIAASKARFLLIVGESGLGKTRLAETASHGDPVLWLRFRENASSTPLAALAETIREQHSPSRLRALGPAVWRELLRLVPELEPTTLPDDTPRPEGRVRFLEALARALETLAGGDGTLLLDDLHWADATSLEVILHLARQRSSGPRLIATAWPQALEERAELRALVNSLERDGQLERLDLEPLSAEAVGALARHSGLRLAATTLHRATGGNPHFVLETLRALLDDQTPAEGATLPLGSGLQASVLTRVDRLGPEVRRLLEAASLAGARFRLEQVAPATGLGDWEAVEALERASLAGLLVPLGPNAEHAFAHDLTRRALETQLNPARRQLIHTHLARAAADRGDQPALVAEHFERAGRRLEALPWRLRAAREAARLYAHREALALYDAALEDGPDAAGIAAIQAARARLLALLGETTVREAAVRAMARAAAQSDDPALSLEAALTQLEFYCDAQRFEEAITVANALPRDLLGAAQARALIGGGRALMHLERPKEAEARLSAVLEIPGVSAALAAEAHTCLTSLARRRGDYGSAEQSARSSLRLYQSVSDAQGELEALITLGQLTISEGRPAEAAEFLETALLRAEATNHGAHQLYALATLPWLYLHEGQVDRAETAASRAEALNLLAGNPRLECNLAVYRALIAAARGQSRRSLELADRALALAEAQQSLSTRIVARLWAGRLYLGAAVPQAATAHFAAALELVVAAQLSAYRLAAEVGLALGALRLGDAAGAAARLEASRCFLEAADAEDRAEYGLALAELRLQLGDAATALQATEAPGLTPAQQARRLELRLEAHERLSTDPADDLAAALALLESDRLPRPAWSALHSLVQCRLDWHATDSALGSP